MLEWLAKYWLEALFSGVLAGAGCIIRKLWEQQKQTEAKQEANNKGTCALLRDRIVQSYYHYFERGWITLHGLESVEKMYEEYHNLGGNGTITKLVEDLKELPVRDKVAVMQEQQEQEEAEATAKD